MEMETYLDDNVIIPDWIKKMAPEEKRAEIERLEREAQKEKARIMSAKK